MLDAILRAARALWPEAVLIVRPGLVVLWPTEAPRRNEASIEARGPAALRYVALQLAQLLPEQHPAAVALRDALAGQQLTFTAGPEAA